MTLGKLIVTFIVLVIGSIYYYNWDLTKDNESTIGMFMVISTWIGSLVGIIIGGGLIIEFLKNHWKDQVFKNASFGELLMIATFITIPALMYFNWELTKNPDSTMGYFIAAIAWIMGITVIVVFIVFLIAFIIKHWETKIFKFK